MLTQRFVPEGLKHHRDALEIAERAATADPGHTDWQRSLALVAMQAGDALAKHAPPADALKTYLRGYAVAGRLARSGPDNPVQPRDAYVLHVIGLRVAGILSRLGQAAEALKYFRESAAIAERYAAADADSVQWQRALVTANRELAERGDQPAQRWAVVIDQLRKLIANGKQDKHDLFSLAEAEKGFAAAKR